jgi:hypothetical protein
MLEQVNPPATGAPSNRPSVLTRSLNGLYLVAALPAAALLYLILRFTPNVPFWDQYAFVPLIAKLHSGSYTFNDFWMQHNEHRIITQKLLEIGLAALGGWDAIKEVLTSFVFTLGVCAATFLLLKQTVDKHLRAPLALAGSLLIFSTIQYENQIWGMDMSWYLILLCVVFSLTAVTVLWPGTKKAFFLAFGLTVVATYSNSLGMPLWVCVLLGMLALRHKWRWRYIAAWAVLAAVTLGTYFIGYRYHGTPKTIPYILSHLLDFSAYFFSYLAAPWLDGPFIPLVTLLGVAALTWGTIYNWRLAFSKKVPDAAKDPALWRATLPWLLIALFGLANAALTSYGRFDLGLEQAQASRYTTISIWFWIAALVIASLALQQVWRRRPEAKLKIGGASATLSVIFLVLYAVNYLGGYRNMEKWYERLNQAIPFLYDYPSAPPDIVYRFYPDAELTRQRLWTLDQAHESIFRPEKVAENKASQAATLRLYDTPAKKLYAYPPDLMTMVLGEASSVTRTPDLFGFNRAGQPAVNIFVNAKNFASQQETTAKNRVLYIQTQDVWYSYIYWDTGKGFNQGELNLLYPVKDGKDNVVMAVKPPANLQAFRVDLYYSAGRQMNVTLKVAMYEAN